MNSSSLSTVLAGLLALGLAGAPARSASAPSSAGGDCLTFRDGDMLYGKLLEIQPSHHLLWQHPDSSQPIDFKLDSAAQIDFAPRAPVPTGADSACKLWLANGDMLTGKLVGCDNNLMRLETWYAGALKIPRRALQTLALNPRAPLVFDSITGLDGWTQGNAVKGLITESGQWIYRNGAFYSDKAASIARDLKLPDQARIQFDMVWRGPLSLAIALYTDSLQPILLSDRDNGPDFGGFYSLRFLNTVFVSLTPVRKKGPLLSLGDPLIIQSLTQKDRVHVDLRVSKADRRVALFLDGGLIKDWIDPNGFAGEGTGLRFVNQAGSTVKISNLRVSQWNGASWTAVPSDSPDPAHDVVTLESGDKISGAVTAIANGLISMVTVAGTTNVPLAGITAIDFAPFQGQAPTPSAVNTHATFVQGGSVTFELLSWRPDGVAGLSPDFGKVTFNPAAFDRLQFPTTDPAKAPAPGN